VTLLGWSGRVVGEEGEFITNETRPYTRDGKAANGHSKDFQEVRRSIRTRAFHCQGKRAKEDND
jgi:hypothetical protein